VTSLPVQRQPIVRMPTLSGGCRFLTLNAGPLRCRNLSGVGGRPDLVTDIAKTALMTLNGPSRLLFSLRSVDPLTRDLPGPE
jgi:hypothetical protein